MGDGSAAADNSEVAIPRSRQLSTDEARSRLYPLINELAAIESSDASLIEHAIEIGPRRRGGALLIPTADVETTLARIRELEDRVESLHQEREDALLAAMVMERRSTPTDELLTIEELAATVGHSDLISDS